MNIRENFHCVVRKSIQDLRQIDWIENWSYKYVLRFGNREESCFHSGHFLKVFSCNPVQNSAKCVCAIVFHICKMWRFVETISFCVFHLKLPSHRSHSFAPMLVYVYLLLSIYLFSFLYLDASKPFSFWLTVLCFDVFLYALGSQWIICDRTHFLS